MNSITGSAHFEQAMRDASIAESGESMGFVFQIAGSSSQLLLETACLAGYSHSEDPSIGR